MLSVLHVVPSINPGTGGPAASVPGIADAIARSGARVVVASLDYSEHGRVPDTRDARNAVTAPSALGKRMRGWSPQLRRLIVRETARADIVHSHALWMVPGIYARQAALRSGKRLVISPRGMLDPWALSRGRMKKKLAALLYENRNLRTARLLHATSAAEADSIRHYGLRQPIAVLPNGVDLPAGPAPPRAILERRFPELTGARWLLFLGRLDPKKGLDVLLEIWRGLAPRHPDWRLVVAGPDLEGFGARMVRRVRADSGLRERVTFTGMLEGEEKRAALEQSELFVLPTLGENFGIAVAEALAHGTPVVTTTAAPWRELVGRECGWWVEPPPATGALRTALEIALRLSPGELSEMGFRGRDLVDENYGWSSIGDSWMRTYRWVLEGGAPPSWVLER